MVLTPLGNAGASDIPVDAHLSVETMVGSYGQKYVEYEPNSARFGVLPVIKIWDNIEDVIQLYNTAQNWINANSKVETQINISAVDLADAGQDVEHFREGQIITATSRPHSIIAQQFVINKMKIELFRPEQSKLEINSEV